MNLKPCRGFFRKHLRPTLFASEMQSAGVRIIFQPPGFMFVTLPVRSCSNGRPFEFAFFSELLALEAKG